MNRENSNNAEYPEAVQSPFNHTEMLVKANLQRVRGKFDDAEKTCLEILSRHPNQPDCLALLGDICHDQHAYDAALQWYNLATTVPNCPASVQVKQVLLEKKVKEIELESTEKHFDLPIEPQSRAIVAAVSCTIIFVAILIAFWAGSHQAKSTALDNSPILFPSDQPLSSKPIDSSSKLSNPETVPAGSNPTASDHASSGDFSVQYESYFQPLMAVKTPEIVQISNLAYDPRNHSAVITAKQADLTDPAKLAISLGNDAFDSLQDLRAVTIRINDGVKLCFIADETRESYELFKSDPTDQNNGGSGSTQNSPLLNIWTPASSSVKNVIDPLKPPTNL